MSWLKFLRLPALAAVFVCWPLVPMNTDDSWVADGTVAATWLAIINWLLPAAAIAGLYILVRKKRLTPIAFACWLCVALTLVFNYFLARSLEEVDTSIFHQTVDVLWERGCPEAIPGAADRKHRHMKIWLIRRGFRWPIYYEKTGPESCELYVLGRFGSKHGMQASSIVGMRPL